jgi:hypothetical protein
VLVVVSVLSNWVKREALDTDTFKSTSQELIAHPAIQDQLAQTMVEQLYANVDVSAAARAEAPAEPPVAGRADRRDRARGISTARRPSSSGARASRRSS